MYFDLQINGYAGVDFNSPTTVESLHHACQRLKDDGVTGILATIITDERDGMCQRLKSLVKARQQDPLIREMLVGFHIEGPFINPQPGYVGAHPVSHVRPANLDDLKRLLDAAADLTRIVTLAPEVDRDQRMISWLSSQGVVVSAGHCNPDHQTLCRAIDAGLSMFTHLGNGCPRLMERHDNIIQRVLANSDRLWIGWIADGVHVPFFALRNYLQVTGLERVFIVTDAIAAAGCGPGSFRLGEQTVMVDPQGATWSADRQHLVGSASTMNTMADLLIQQLGLTQQQVRQLTYHHPRQAILLEDPAGI